MVWCNVIIDFTLYSVFSSLPNSRFDEMWIPETFNGSDARDRRRKESRGRRYRRDEHRHHTVTHSATNQLGQVILFSRLRVWFLVLKRSPRFHQNECVICTDTWRVKSVSLSKLKRPLIYSNPIYSYLHQLNIGTHSCHVFGSKITNCLLKI